MGKKKKKKEYKEFKKLLFDYKRTTSITTEKNNSIDDIPQDNNANSNIEKLLGHNPCEQKSENINKLNTLKKFHFQEFVELNAKSEEKFIKNFPIFCNKSPLNKNKPLAYEAFSFIRENFNIFSSNTNNCLYIYNQITGCHEVTSLAYFGIFLSKIFKQSEILPFLDNTLKKMIFQFLLNDYSRQVDSSFFDNQERFINVHNGVVDLTTGKLEEHSPQYGFLTSLTFDYLEDYALGSSIPPKFKEMIDQNFPEPDEQMRFLQCLAYLISNRYSNKVAFYWFGKPHTGKSTYQRLLTGIVGENLVSNLPLRKLSKRFAIATLFNKKLNFCSETGRSPIKNLDVFKALIGNDYIDAEFKGKDHFSFRAKTKCVFAGNDMLNIDSSIAEEAIFDRFEFIKFRHPTKKKEQIPFFEKTLLNEEGSQILSFLIRILRQWYESGCLFMKTEDSRELKKTFKHLSEEPDAIKSFIDDCCKIDTEAKISYADLFALYLKYCKQNCFIPLTQQSFIKQIIIQTGAEKKRFHPSRSMQFRGLNGISIKKKYS